MATAKKNPNQMLHFVTDSWKKIAQENLNRLETLQAEFAKLEEKGNDQAKKAIDETAALMRSSLDTASDLSQAWRKTAEQTMNRTLEAFEKRA